jgi:hypothetical protein
MVEAQWETRERGVAPDAPGAAAPPRGRAHTRRSARRSAAGARAVRPASSRDGARSAPQFRGAGADHPTCVWHIEMQIMAPLQISCGCSHPRHFSAELPIQEAMKPQELDVTQLTCLVEYLIASAGRRRARRRACAPPCCRCFFLAPARFWWAARWQITIVQPHLPQSRPRHRARRLRSWCRSRSRSRSSA